MKEYNRHVGNSPMWGKPMEYKFIKADIHQEI